MRPPVVKAFERHSLNSQIALVFGGLAVAVAVLVSLLMGELLVHRIRSEAAQSMALVSRHAARLLAAGLQHKITEVQVLAQSELLWAQGLDTPGVADLLSRQQSLSPADVWIGVVDSSGIVRSATGRLLEGQSVRERTWFIEGLRGPHLGDVRLAQLLAGLLPVAPGAGPLRFLDFTAPIQSQGRTLGVLVVHTTWDWVGEIAALALPANAASIPIELLIFDRQGELILAPPGRAADLARTGQRLPAGLERGGPHGSAGPVLEWGDGQRYLSAGARLPAVGGSGTLDWTIVTRMPEAIAYADVQPAIVSAVAVGLLSAVLMSGLGWLAARRLSADLGVIARAAGQVEAGTAGASIPLLHSSRDVGLLSSALHHMTDRLVHAKERMEAEVYERTQALQAANAELERIASLDALTGLYNRRGFEDRLPLLMAMAQRGRRPLSLMLVDADHFKQINDRYGHDIGDVVLKHLAQSLRQRLRQSDVVARLGGEEFVLVLTDTELPAALGLGQTLLNDIASHRDPVYGAVTASAGISLLRPGDDGASLLRRADEALYRAKGAGRNQVAVEEN